MDNAVRILAFFLIFMAGCGTVGGMSALELQNHYGCAACKPEECKLCVDDVCKPCGTGYLCCKEFVPEEHRYIFDCKYDPLLD